MPGLPDMSNLPKISLSRKQIIMIGGGLFLVVAIVVLVLVSGKNPDVEQVTLRVWGTDTAEVFQPLITGYTALRPNVTVEYTPVAAGGYEGALLTALAAGSGPDVFMIGNHDLLRWGALLAAAPEGQVPLADMEATFPLAAVQDLTYDGYVYALPLHMDTLRLVYNKQMLDQAGIALPPTTWENVLSLVPDLRVVDQQGQVQRAALAMGGTEDNVEHATDILNLLMLQNGATLANDQGVPSFGQNAAAREALQFYLQFANAGSPSYTWNGSLGNSLESFASQNAALAFAYQEDLPGIRARAPFLDFGVAPMPQASPAAAVNYPKYRALAVWTGSRSQAWAWDLVVFASTNLEAQRAYLAASGRSSALRTLIAEQQDRSALTARSWKMGDYDKIKAIFSSAIQDVLTGAKTPSAALKDAEAQASQLVRR